MQADVKTEAANMIGTSGLGAGPYLENSCWREVVPKESDTSNR